MMEGFCTYISEPFNWLDLFGNISIMMSAHFIVTSKQSNEFYENGSKARYLICGMMIIGLRAVTSLRIFEQYRVQIQLFKQVFKDFIWFMSLLMLLVVLMSIAYGIESVKNTDDNTKVATTDSIKTNFFSNIGVFYMFLNGENPYSEVTSPTAWIIYIIFTLLVQVVALNLLIAILSETFANVYAQMDANHCRTKVEILLEISGLKCLFEQNDDRRYYMHFFIYLSDKLTSDDSEQVEHQVEEISNKIVKITDKIDAITATQQDLTESIDL